MSSPRVRARAERDLRAAVHQRGFTPSVRDADALLAMLVDNDAAAEDIDAIERALVKIGAPLLGSAKKFVAHEKPEGRGRSRIVRAVGKLAPCEEVTTFLLDTLGDDDAKARRNAIVALGKMQDARVEDALLAAWTPALRVDHARSIAASLGKVGGAKSLEKLRSIVSDDKELTRIASQARLVLERTLSRARLEAGFEASGIDGDARTETPRPVIFHCREGLEPIVVGELGERWNATVAPPGRVHATLRGSIADAYRARTFLSLGFPLQRVVFRSGEAIEDAVARALTGPEARAIFRSWTRGAVRYRIAFGQGGHQRALVWKIARAVSAKDPTLINDPRESTWEVVLRERGTAIDVEILPRAFVDPRFTYRMLDVPAASHPTLAAAIARVASARPDDVVWDPFAGSATELIERARLGPYVSLTGTDTDDRAIAAARANSNAAGIERIDIVYADAREFTPPKSLSLVLTNPPMGRRVLPGENLAVLLERVIDRAAQLLAPNGRLVWLSPIAASTRARAASRGLTLEFSRAIDMGGFSAELQRFRQKPA